jgi:hypothetical protein
MNEPGDDRIDLELMQLAERTAALGPSPGFVSRVMQRLDVEGGWRLEILRSARRLVPVATLLALLGVVWALSSAAGSESELAGVDIGTELEW